MLKILRSLMKHVRGVHEKEKQFQCDICEMSFISSSTLRNHFNIFHSTVPIIKKKYPCKSCGKNLSTEANMIRHVKSVHDSIKNPQM